MILQAFLYFYMAFLGSSATHSEHIEAKQQQYLKTC